MSANKRLAVFFPGVGYHNDKPLMYYSRKLAASMDYEVVVVNFSDLPTNIKGDEVKMKQAFDIAYSQTEEQLSEVNFDKYERVVFIGKSIGTAIAGTYAKQHNISVEFIVFTPVPQTFEAIADGDAKVFHGLADPWCDNEICEQSCKEKGFYLAEYSSANHSLETGNVVQDAYTISQVMGEVEYCLSEKWAEKRDELKEIATPLMMARIIDTDLSRRVAYDLAAGGVRYVYELLDKNEYSLREIPGLGGASIEKILDWMRENGLKFNRPKNVTVILPTKK